MHSVFIFMASWWNVFLTKWKIFSIRFRWELRAGIENFRVPVLSQADLGLQIFCDWSPSCKNNFPFGLEHSLNMLAKCSSTKEENGSALILPKYCSAAIIPFLYDIATIKGAILPPVPLWLPFAVKPKPNPYPGFFHTIAVGAMAWSKGFMFCVKISPSKENVTPPVQKSFGSFQQTFQANFNINFRSLFIGTPFFWAWLHFNPIFLITLRTVAALTDSRIPLFSITLFTLKFPTASWCTLGWRKMFLFVCPKASLVCLDFLFIY